MNEKPAATLDALLPAEFAGRLGLEASLRPRGPATQAAARSTVAIRWRGGGLIGVGFSFEATQEEGHDCGKVNCSRHFRLPENTHAPPTCTLSVEGHRWQGISANDKADGRLLGVVEPWHDR